jgi:3-oxoacyl-[acyl-carrier protein] reductase
MSRLLALITGGTSGIGFGIAKSLGKNYDLALTYAENEERAIQSQIEIKSMYPDCHLEIFKKPLVQYSDAVVLYNEVKENFGLSPAILVNSAGKLRDQLFLGSKFQDHVDHVNEHLLIPMALAHVSLKAMSAAKFGRIINLSSISANYAKRGQTNYAAAKAGIEGFTRTLALEVAHRGITVNAIAPGLIETPMTKQFVDKIEAEGSSIRSRIPVGRVGKPEEVGSLVQFLCSKDASYMTGSVFTIDGGRSLGDPQS